jgi:hypothetical protein
VVPNLLRRIPIVPDSGAGFGIIRAFQFCGYGFQAEGLTSFGLIATPALLGVSGKLYL